MLSHHCMARIHIRPIVSYRVLSCLTVYNLQTTVHILQSTVYSLLFSDVYK